MDNAPKPSLEAIAKIAADKATIGDLPAMEPYEQAALWTVLCERRKNQQHKFDVRSFNMWLTLAVDFASVTDLKEMPWANRESLWEVFSKNLTKRGEDIRALLRFGSERQGVLVALVVEFGTEANVASLNDEEKKLLLKVLDGIRHDNVNAWDPLRHQKMWLAANGGVAPEQSYRRDSERIFTEKTRRGQ